MFAFCLTAFISTISRQRLLEARTELKKKHYIAIYLFIYVCMYVSYLCTVYRQPCQQVHNINLEYDQCCVDRKDEMCCTDINQALQI